MYGKQLLYDGILAELASKLQSLDCSVCISYRPIYGTVVLISHTEPSYIYVPVGGGQNVIVATLLVFTFVALWHDLSMKLLMWGWLVSLFFLPELSARRIFNEKQVKLHPNRSRMEFLTYTYFN